MNSEQINQVLIENLSPSKTNPRRNFDKEKLQKLTESVAEYGVLQPLLVRPVDGRYEIVAGERRYLAAQAAKLDRVPVMVREMDDTEVLELQMIENLERDDLHPLEEARGYQQLIQKGKGYDAAKIAVRIGRSVKYVHDRVKLLQLTKPLQEEFLAGKFEAGHAILLARLAPKDQERAADPDAGGLFQYENTLWDPYEEVDGHEAVKARSVRELDGWIAEHVKFQAERDAEPLLFPEAAAALESGDKIVPITHDYIIKRDARDGKRVLTKRSWVRADGQEKSKTCDRSVMGMIVVGPGRGDAFRVCIDKKKCHTHYGKEIRERAKRAAGGNSKTAQQRREEAGDRQRERYEAEQKRREEEVARWKKALPAIRKALAEKIAKAPARARGFLGDIIIRAVTGRYGYRPAKELARGQTAVDLVRYAAFLALDSQTTHWDAWETFPKKARAFGLDVRKIVDEVAPKPKPQTSAQKKKTARKKK